MSVETKTPLTEDEVKAVVREAFGDEPDRESLWPRVEAIAARVAAQLAGRVGLSEEERSRALVMRSRAKSMADEWDGWPTQKMYLEEVALLDRLLGGKP